MTSRSYSWGFPEQEKRSQMLKDVKALSSANGPGLVHFYGAYHSPEAGQVMILLNE
jgi:hypothetical protein